MGNLTQYLLDEFWLSVISAVMFLIMGLYLLAKGLTMKNQQQFEQQIVEEQEKIDVRDEDLPFDARMGAYTKLQTDNKSSSSSKHAFSRDE